jgi:hypothetical protein
MKGMFSLRGLSIWLKQTETDGPLTTDYFVALRNKKYYTNPAGGSSPYPYNLALKAPMKLHRE